ncbi:MAG: hypothetical protein AMXMBFR44_2530 [Candidatus Campbellbacteria bacterium]
MNNPKEMFPVLEAEITHVVEPTKVPASSVIRFCVFDVGHYDVSNPLFKEGSPEFGGKRMTGSELMEMLLRNDWVLLSLCWIRKDGHTNYGHEPTVNHELVATMAKIKAS